MNYNVEFNVCVKFKTDKELESFMSGTVVHMFPDGEFMEVRENVIMDIGTWTKQGFFGEHHHYKTTFISKCSSELAVGIKMVNLIKKLKDHGAEVIEMGVRAESMERKEDH